MAANLAARLVLERAVYRHYPQPLVAQETPLAVMRDWLCDELAAMANDLTSGLAREEIAAHLVCSTSIDRPFCGGLYDWQQMRERIGHGAAFVPETVINAYECASWGYSLRYVLRQRMRDRRHATYAVIHIADVNVLNLGMWEANDNWGKSGFGITSLLIRIDGAPADIAITTGASKTNQRVAEFVMDVRKEARKREPMPVALPFFPANVTGMLDRSLAGIPRLADLHPQYGHCFGSDPWLAIIHDAVHSGVPKRYLATSIALVGYWAIAEIETCAHGIYRIEEKLT